MNYPTVVLSEDLAYNFNEWIPFRNTFSIHCVNQKLPFPKTLVQEGWKLFLDEAKIRHIDPSFYTHARVSRMHTVVWQIEFYQNEDCDGPYFAIVNIYWDGKHRQIMQSEFVLGYT